jgi:pilus assembly protein Flp/PilA
MHPSRAVARTASTFRETAARQAPRMHRKGDALEDQMNYLVTYLKSFVRKDEEGQDLLEYALLVGLIALVCILAVTAAGVKVQGIFEQIAAEI